MKIKKRSDVADALPEEKTEEAQPQKNSRKMELNVILYTVVLFVAAMVLILLSYAIQQRSVSLRPENAVLSGALDAGTPGDYNFTVENILTEDGGAQP